MTTTQVRAHERRLPDKPDRLEGYAFREEIEARKAAKSRRIRDRDEWYRGSGYAGKFRAVAAALRQFITGESRP